VILILASALGFFLVLPKYQAWQDINRQIAEKNIEIKNRLDYYTNLARAAEILDAHGAEMAKINSALPKNLDAPAAMNFLQAAAMQSGLVVKSMEYSGGAVQPPPASKSSLEGADFNFEIKKYFINLAVSGSYADFKNFMAGVERSSRLIGVETVGVNASQAESAAGKKLLEEKEVKLQESDDKIISFDIKNHNKTKLEISSEQL